MSELSKSYEAKEVEKKWYRFWEERGLFKADASSDKKPFAISIPPPNVTGVLHMGHALVNTLQDILIRWKRMLGFEALWVPGTDHAGIATQTIVEKHLIETMGKRRKDFSREEFLGYVWKWKEENEGSIIGQLKKMGCSCDWSRQRFTMDEGCNRAVRKIFKKMYDEGLIYRGDYLVNWDPVTQTAIADDEVEYEERNSFLWHMKYPLKDSSEYIHIATTRPETMLGDTAIAVAPNDPRYTHLIGKTVILPLVHREIPIIADHHVDPEFGTGMVKVTPAHDPNDYQMGITHGLPMINIMTPDGKINENGGHFAGQAMEEARKNVVSEMQRLGLIEKIVPHVNRVGLSYRSKAVIEPYLSKQWFVKMDGFAKELRAIAEEGKIKFIPKNWENTYFHWIDNLRDWCISRQLWWGHRIPVWYNKQDPSRMICSDGEDVPEELLMNPEEWEQDHDVMDTWFSSALWPFSILGWPDHTADLKKFYPNAVLVTGYDILFFWVARMLFMGEYAMGELPFPETFLNGLIFGKSYWRDQPGGGISYLKEKERKEYDLGKTLPPDVHFKWEKMSKTKGNVIDPLEIIEDYGTDAMRMALCASATHAREIDLDLRKFEEFKNFANKVWNGARFVFMNLDGDKPLTSKEFSDGLNESLLKLEDRWILSVLAKTVKSVNEKLSQYAFDQAALQAYDFFWKEFCSYYVEISKPVLFGKVGTEEERKNKQKLLAIVLCQSMRLIHPMAPFITEELFQSMKAAFPDLHVKPDADPYTQEAVQALQAEACIVAPYPKVLRESDLHPEIDRMFELVEEVVYSIRNLRGEMKIPPAVATDIYIIGKENDSNYSLIKDQEAIIGALVKNKKIEFTAEEPRLGFSSTSIVESLKILIPLPDEFLKQEKVRLDKEKDRVALSLEKVRGQLGNEEFVSRAPAQLIEKQKITMAQLEGELAQIEEKLKQL